MHVDITKSSNESCLIFILVHLVVMYGTKVHCTSINIPRSIFIYIVILLHEIFQWGEFGDLGLWDSQRTCLFE